MLPQLGEELIELWAEEHRAGCRSTRVREPDAAHYGGPRVYDGQADPTEAGDPNVWVTKGVEAASARDALHAELQDQARSCREPSGTEAGYCPGLAKLTLGLGRRDWSWLTTDAARTKQASMKGDLISGHALKNLLPKNAARRTWEGAV